MKRYASSVKLAKAFLDQDITGPSHCLDYTITADQDHIWNGDKVHLLIVRNHKLGLVVALNLNVCSLGSSANTMLTDALSLRGKYRWTRDADDNHVRVMVSPPVCPVPVARVNSVLPEHEFCDLATLQSCVLEACKDRLEKLLRKLNVNKSPYGKTYLDENWDEIVKDLAAVQLSVPEELTDKKAVIEAKQRLLTN